MALKFLAVLAAAGVAFGQTVTIANGTVQGGKCPQADINFFLSIPYAEPPVGDLRFAAPKTYNHSFNGTYNATNAAPVCPQFGPFFVESAPWSEDCLFIDVYAPATAQKGSNLPVKVWIYGGADQAGGISSPAYDGCFSANDSILVSMNYRLGPLGFLALEPAGLTGNYAIQDQLLGLHWVQENIAAFGGDKDQVLLFGQSAGSWTAFTIATVPQAKSLMKAAALESGAGTDFPTLAETTKFHEFYATQLNCSASDVGCLRSKTVVELNNTFLDLPSNGAPLMASLFVNSGNSVSWGPVVDGTIVPAQPSSAGVQVPAIIGSNESEGTVFVLLDYLAGIVSLNQTEYESVLVDYFGPFATDVNATYPYSDFSTAELQGFAAIANVITDYGFRCPAYRALLGGIANGVPVYAYNFNHTPSCPWISGLKPSLLPIVGPSHTAELPFVFGLVDTTVYNCTFTSAEKQLGEFMRAAWTSMAATGTPGRGWPTFAANSSQGINFEASALVGTMDYSVCAFWDQIDARVSQLDANTTAAATGNASTTGATTGASGTATKKSAGARVASTGMAGLSAVVLAEVFVYCFI